MEHRTLTAHPKIHAADSGLAAWAARMDDAAPAALYGSMLETLVVNELIAQSGWLSNGPVIRHWRDTAKKLEVDAVILQSDGRSLPVEVEAGADIRPDDLKGLRAYLESVAGATRGLAFYTGERTLKLDENIWAVPISSLWNGFAKPAAQRR
jgi:uncharacterized protein